MKTKKILWNLFHEDINSSRGNKALSAVAEHFPSSTFRNLYEVYPEFKIDVPAEQELLVQHDLIVFQHPFYWYSTPALMKEWEDKVLTYGFAYPPKEGTALHGKKWLSVITTSGPEWSYKSGGYNNFTMSELLRPLQQTAYLCGMDWLSPFIVHSVLPGDYEGIKATDNTALAKQVESLKTRISQLDFDKRHSLEPVAAPHYMRKIESA